MSDVVDGVASASTDVSLSDSYPQTALMLRTLKLEATFDDTDSGAFVLDIMEKILAAESVEDIFEAQESGMISGKDFASRPFLLTSEGITIRKSSMTDPNALPIYAILRVTEIATGEECVLNCGGKTFMAVLHALRQASYFDDTENYPNGRALVIVSVPSPAGAYLQLKPYKQPKRA